MRRRTFDILVATAGLFLAVMLIVSGVLLTWAHTFIGNEVHTQLAAQQIYFPASNSPAIKAPEFAAMHQYAIVISPGSWRDLLKVMTPCGRRPRSTALWRYGQVRYGLCSSGPSRSVRAGELVIRAAASWPRARISASACRECAAKHSSPIGERMVRAQ